jgi:hypothetical protein
MCSAAVHFHAIDSIGRQLLLTPGASLQNAVTLLLFGIVPDAVKAPGIARGIPDGMADISVAEVVLNKAGIDAHIASANPHEWRSMWG